MPIRFQVDGDFYDHPKTLGLSDAAVALWTRAGAYSTHKLLDGFVPDNALAVLSRTPEEASGELVQRGLWRRVRGGFKFHQWDERNLLRARVEADRDYDRTRKQRERQAARRKAAQQANGTSVRSGQPPDSEPDSRGSPHRSVSVSVSESVSGSGRGDPPSSTAPSTPGAEPPPQCPAHVGDSSPPPCGACADARRANDRWQTDRRRRIDEAPRCRKHAGQPAANCGPCRSELIGDRYAPGWNAKTTTIRAVAPVPRPEPA